MVTHEWYLVWIYFFCVCIYAVSGVSEKCYRTWQNGIDDRGDRNTYPPDIWSGIKRNDKEMKDLFGLQNKTILLIHVGKTCGSSVNIFMRAEKIKHVEVHRHPVDEIMVNQFDYVLITVREPLERVVSAFNFANPRHKGFHNVPKYRKGEKPPGKFYDCFNYVNEYANALYTDTFCGAMANDGRGCEHIGLNYCSYVGGMMHQLEQRKQSVYLLRTQTCENDLYRFLSIIGYTGPFKNKFTHKNLVVTHTKNSTYLSEEGRGKLKRHLEEAGEYDIYNELLSLFSKW
jgi:hypothetical protein